jgi:hypothetical protein
MFFLTTASSLILARRTLCGTIAIILATSSLFAAENANDPALPKPVWLSDLPEKNVQVGYGSFGKNGWARLLPRCLT